MTTPKRLVILFGLLFSVWGSGCSVIAWTRAKLSQDNQSRYENKRIQSTRALPPWGKGYTIYSSLGAAIGRQYGHDKVITTLMDGFSELNRKQGHRYIVAEIGWPNGDVFALMQPIEPIERRHLDTDETPIK